MFQIKSKKTLLLIKIWHMHLKVNMYLYLPVNDSYMIMFQNLFSMQIQHGQVLLSWAQCNCLH